jgi:hypothetical protein
VRQLSGGGYIVAGYTTSSSEGDVGPAHGLEDFWVVELSNAGSIVWQKCYGGPAADRAYAIRQTSDNGYIVAGSTASSSEGDVGVNHGGNDYWLLKLNSSGDLEWQQCYGGSGNDRAYAVQQTDDGGYILNGFTASADGDVTGFNGGYDLWVVKLTSTGSLEWQHSLGGTSNDYGYDIRQTTDGGYIAAGYTSSSDVDVTDHIGSFDFWVLKLTSTGVLTWAHCYGGSGIDQADNIHDFGSGYIVTGSTASNDNDVSGNHGSRDYWLIKLNATGTLTEQRCFGGSSDDYGKGIYPTSDSGYIVVGVTESNDYDVSGFKGGTTDWWVLKK